MNGYSTCSVVATQENITDLLYFLKERGFVTSTVSLDYLVRNPQCKYLHIYVSRDNRKAYLQNVWNTTHFHNIKDFKFHITNNFPPNFSVLIKNTEDAKSLIENYSQFFKDREFDLSSFNLDAYSSKNMSNVSVSLNYLTTNKKGDNKSLCFTSEEYKNWAGRILCKSVDEFLNKIAEHYKITKKAQIVEAANKVDSIKIYSIEFRAEYLENRQDNFLCSWEMFVKYVIRNLEDILSNKIDKEYLTKYLLELSGSDFFLNLYLQDGVITRWMKSNIAPTDSFICYSVGDFRKELIKRGNNLNALIPISSFCLEIEQEIRKENSTTFTPLEDNYRLLLRRNR